MVIAQKEFAEALYLVTQEQAENIAKRIEGLSPWNHGTNGPGRDKGSVPTAAWMFYFRWDDDRSCTFNNREKAILKAMGYTPAEIKAC
jgi:hypothetical protein